MRMKCRDDEVVIGKNNTVKLLAVTVLALQSLRDRNFAVFTEICQKSGGSALRQICALDIKTCLLPREAVLALLRNMGPKSGQLRDADPALVPREELVDLALQNYFKYPPYGGLEPRLPLAVRATSSRLRGQDLLVQNSGLFLQAVEDLVTDLLQKAPGEGEVDEEAMMMAGWQAAMVVGCAFKYATDYAMRVGEGIERAQAILKVGVDLLLAALGSVSQGPGPSAGEAVSAVVVTKLGEKAAVWGTRPARELDFAYLAKELALFSDHLKTSLRRGRLLPFSPETSEEEFTSLPKNLQVRRIALGPSIYERYSQVLAQFQDHYLQSGLKKSDPT